MVVSQHSHLWNDMPFDERKRLMPYAIETHILHLTQTRAMIVEGHRATLDRLDSQIKNLRNDLAKRDEE
jgi:hypothetical protein